LRLLLAAAALLLGAAAEQPVSEVALVLSAPDTPIPLDGLAVHLEYARCAASPSTCIKLEVIPIQGIEPKPVSGSIPTEMGLLSNIQRLSLYNTKVNGTLPTEIGMLTALTTLSIHNNFIVGQFPSEIGLCTGLRHIFAYKNEFTGTLPSSLGNLTALESFFMSSNKITGSIPPSLGNLTWAHQFSLHNNKLTGPVPSELGRLINLNAFYLSENQLTGVVPAQLMAQLVRGPQWSVCDNEELSTNMTAERLTQNSLGDVMEEFPVCSFMDLYSTSAASSTSSKLALLVSALVALMATF